MNITLTIISVLALILQVWFLVKQIPSYLTRRRKRRFYHKIMDFQQDNLEDLTHAISENNREIEDSAKIILDIFNQHDELRRMHFNEDVTYKELKNGFLELKISYSEHLPAIKKELRTKNIDNILNN